MRKLLITFTIALLIIPTLVFAQEGPAQALREALNAKLSPSIEARQAKSTEPQQEGPAQALRETLNAKLSPSIEALQAKSIEPQNVSANITYHYGATFNYQASNASWWTGLVVRNGTSFNYINVRLFDYNGTLTGEGTFYITAFNEQGVGMLNQWIVSGYVPTIGSVYVFGTNYFETMMFVGNSNDGFGMLDKEPIYF